MVKIAKPDVHMIYGFNDYKAYLNAAFAKATTRGRRTELAKFLGCKPAFISQVLNAWTHLSVEQAYKVSLFLELDPEETSFFLLLVQHDRAGSAELRQYLRKLILGRRRARSQVGERLSIRRELTSEAAATYYSSWHYAAIHVMTSVPKYQKPEAIAARLGLSRGAVIRYLEFLVQAKLVIFEAGRFRIGPSRIHLRPDSVLIGRHHSNWRLQSMLACEKEDAAALHYSLVMTLAKADAERVKEILLEALAASERILIPSAEEEVYTLCLDFFELGAAK